MTLNDAILAATGGPTVNDGLRAYYNAHGVPYGALQDMERAFLRIQMPVAEGSNQDLWMQYLSGVWGYEGTLNDMLYQFWLASGSIGLSWQDMVDLYFSNGEQGVIYPLNPAEGCVFQDAAGTIPCTGPNQPVGLVLDVSGNGNHASQSTTTKRPMLRQDGDLWYLQGDGIDDFASTADVDFTGTGKMTVWAGVLATNTESTLFETGTGWYNATGSFGAFGSSDTFSYGASTAGGVVSSNTAATATATSSGMVVTGQTDFSLAIPQNFISVNGVVGTPSSESAGSGNFGNYPLYLLSRAGAALFFSGNLYSLMIRGAETTDLTPGNEYTAQLTGITLP